MDLNLVALTGNLTSKPALRRTPNGAAVTTLRVASNGSRRTGNSGWLSKVCFCDVEVWGQTAENCVKFLDKGSHVEIKGELEFQEWTDTATEQRRTKLIVRADHVGFGPNPNRDHAPAPQDQPDAASPAPAAAATYDVQGVAPQPAPGPPAATGHLQPQGLPPQMAPAPLTAPASQQPAAAQHQHVPQQQVAQQQMPQQQMPQQQMPQQQVQVAQQQMPPIAPVGAPAGKDDIPF